MSKGPSLKHPHRSLFINYNGSRFIRTEPYAIRERRTTNYHNSHNSPVNGALTVLSLSPDSSSSSHTGIARPIQENSTILGADAVNENFGQFSVYVKDLQFDFFEDAVYSINLAAFHDATQEINATLLHKQRVMCDLMERDDECPNLKQQLESESQYCQALEDQIQILKNQT
ncbi:hypothetical protein CC78DRAFT_545740 [Lojkania enalia]|uniref:Uncharacterized protein n=1 Tax=Lojkania enalia TaxID=147567 RepID=A0A9P4K5N1_9PLEO|nr:hypothetical protein CC78DRAFT_545740 [Didymosphaeria enalia]